jgi:membrane-associated phospholipid phosphatase
MNKENFIRKSVLILVGVLFFSPAFAENDTIRISERQQEKTPLAYCIVPSALITYGVVAQFFSDGLRNFDFRIDEKVQQNIHRRYTFDDYIQYAPYIGIYGLDLLGVKAKHNFLDRTLVLGTSMIFTSVAVHGTKRLTKIGRPDNPANTQSFPSGHTAMAFMGAHILFREYKHVSPWIGAAGYTFAATTATMRVINRRHWLSDVVAGAGVAILCVELSYLMLPVWHRVFNINPTDKRLALSPIISQNSFGIGGIIIF